jgi:hypothetical protein
VIGYQIKPPLSETWLGATNWHFAALVVFHLIAKICNYSVVIASRRFFSLAAKQSQLA